MSDEYEQSYKVAKQCLQKAQPHTKVYDRITFYLRCICDITNRHDEGTYWMAVSALSEIQQGLRRQFGLWSLAERMDDSELERAYRFIRFSSEVVSQSGTVLQTQYVLPVMTTLAKEHDVKVTARSREQQMFILVLTLLSLALIAALSFALRQRKKLADSRNQLRESNIQLAETNESLKVMNESLQLSNTKLDDASRVKESYIISFFDMCAGYIDQMDQQRMDSGKLLRAGDTAKLQKKLASPNFTQKELNALYDHFDNVFLGLYPTFVEDFNALLRENARIIPLHKARMNTPLRVFALMRLGIEQPASVARFLHCSSTTVYNYRVQLKNAYLGDRDDFEEAVKRIGLF